MATGKSGGEKTEKVCDFLAKVQRIFKMFLVFGVSKVRNVDFTLLKAPKQVCRRRQENNKPESNNISQQLTMGQNRFMLIDTFKSLN